MGLFASPPPNHQSPVPLHPLEGVEDVVVSFEGEVVDGFEGEVVVGFEGEVVVGFEGNGERGIWGWEENQMSRYHFTVSFHGYVIIKVLKVMGGDGEH